MITNEIKKLFEFIDFLHSNINFLLSKQNLIDEVIELHVKRNTFRPTQNYKERLEYNKIQDEFIKKFDVIKKDTCDLILNKVEELKIATTLTPVLNLKAQADLFELTKSFDESDLLIIFEAKRKYFEYRQKTNCDYFMQLFFHDLDRDLKEFFDYFRDSEISEFSFLNAKTANVTNFGDIEALLKQGKIVKIDLGHDFNRPQIQPLHTETTFSIEEDFKNQYRKIQQMGDSSIAILRGLEHDDDFMSAFLQEFTKASKFADVSKYWGMFYTEAEIEKGFEEINRWRPNENAKNVMANFVGTTPFEDSLYQLRNEFNQLIAQGKIPDSCQTHNIQDTNIYKQLKVVEALFNNFKEMKNYDPDQKHLLRWSEEFGLSMIREIDKINYKPIRKTIIEIIISDTDNIYMNLPNLTADVTCSSLKGFNDVEFSKDYKMTKMYLDNYLSKYISQQTNAIVLTEQSQGVITQNVAIGRKPIFNKQAVQVVSEILKDFFSEEDQLQLAIILKGGDSSSKKLFFRDAGNRLTDALKKLYEHDFIVGCQKQDLINWIIQNFEFRHNSTVKPFLFDTVEKTISRKGAPCKTPLLEVVAGKIQKAEQPKRKNHRKY